jgi:ssDNA-binding Zn-finger/Zn-ribbon topoisomerase 1
MSFKCSVFGHRYGDPDVEREREEQGSEVVITIKETETCKRCGETRVVSENKEVTTLETPSDIVGDDIAEEEEEAAAESATPSEPPAETPEPAAETPEPAVEGGDDAELIDDAETSAPETGDTTGGGETSDFDAPDLGPTETEEAPDADEDDAVILEEDDESEVDEERDPGQWPDEAEDEEEAEDDDWTPSTDEELRPVEDEQPEVQPTSNAVTVPEGEFYCPECDFTTDVESSSLRAGDFCPECHRGSLTHRSDE